jgi:hypothetical protein
VIGYDVTMTNRTRNVVMNVTLDESIAQRDISDDGRHWTAIGTGGSSSAYAPR